MEAVKAIMSGKVWFGHDVISKLIRAINAGSEKVLDPSQEKVLETLTQRELEIAGLTAEGLSNKEIGEKLYISERTVKSHLGTIFQKTGTHSRVQLALLIQRHNRGGQFLDFSVRGFPRFNIERFVLNGGAADWTNI